MSKKIENKYGFVYIWFDRKHKRYYVGYHWGTENDGYICSSNWMRDSYKRRPNDFKRRIIKTNIQNRENTVLEERRFLQMIKNEELGKKYYNLTKNFLDGYGSKNEEDRKKVGQKISEAKKGHVVSEETRRKISETLKGRPINYTRTAETRKKISDNSKRLQAEGKVGTKGKKYSLESRKKMSEWQLGVNNPMYGKKHSEETKQKISKTLKEKKKLINV